MLRPLTGGDLGSSRSTPCAAALLVSALAGFGCTSESSLGAARVSVVQVGLVTGTLRQGPAAPWTLVIIDQSDRRLPLHLDEGGYSDCGDKPQQGCPFRPSPGRMRVESLGFAGVPREQIAAWPVGQARRASVERFSARDASSIYDTIDVVADTSGAPPLLEWTVLARCNAKLVAVSGSTLRDFGSGVIAVPRFRDVRWTELHAPCLPPSAPLPDAASNRP